MARNYSFFEIAMFMTWDFWGFREESNSSSNKGLK